MRDKVIFISVAVIAVVVGVLVFFYSQENPSGYGTASSASAAAQGNATPVKVPVTMVAEGQKSTVTSRTNYLVTSSDALAKLWKMTDATTTVPDVDFTKSDVIGVFAGTDPVLSITVSNVEDASSRMVSVTIIKPGTNCSQKLSTSPYEIVIVPTTTLPITHQDIFATTSCAQ